MFWIKKIINHIKIHSLKKTFASYLHYIDGLLLSFFRPKTDNVILYELLMYLQNLFLIISLGVQIKKAVAV